MSRLRKWRGRGRWPLVSEPTTEQIVATIARMVETFEKMVTLLEQLAVNMEIQGKLLNALVKKEGKGEL